MFSRVAQASSLIIFALSMVAHNVDLWPLFDPHGLHASDDFVEHFPPSAAPTLGQLALLMLTFIAPSFAM
jgi:hypothetical protein